MKANSLPNQVQLKSLLNYSPVEGNFYWKEPGPGRKTGVPAGRLDKSTGYVRIKINQKEYYANRLAWVYTTGEDPGDLQVDHYNGDRSNNAWHNLQLLTNQQNSIKKHTLRGGSSQYRGVSWNKDRRKWQVKIQTNGKTNYLGQYDSEKEAAVVACLYAKMVYHKEHSTYVMP